MPLYTYVCEACGARKTLLRLIAERDTPIFCWGGGPDGTGPGHVGYGPLMRRTYEPAATHFHGLGVTRGSTGFGKSPEAKPQPPEHKDQSPA